MVLAGAVLAAMHGMVRYLSTEMHPFEIAFFRNLFGFMFFVPWIVKVGLGALRTSRIATHGLRAVINATSMLLWFSALSMVPLADVTALSLTGPMFVTLGAIAFLGEKVWLRRWLALALGVGGALVIIRPGFQSVQFGMILAILAPAAAAGAKLLAKSLTRTDKPATVAAYVQLLMTPITLVPALFFWQTPGWPALGWLAVIGCLGGLGHYFFVKAYSIADISFAEPVMFTRLVWAALFGYLAFAEIPDYWTWIGAAMIVGATTYIAHRERRSG